MEIQHFSHKKHPLIFVEELENEVVCSGCEKSVCAPAYECSQCNVFLHKSCAELPSEMQHPMHPSHTLVLQAPLEDAKLRYCDACLKVCERCFFYHCSSCGFDLDIECASISATKPDACHQHEFVPIFQQIQFTCKLCGEDCSSAAQVCLICLNLAHTLCALKPRSIKIIADRHALTLIHSLGKVIKDTHDPVFCNLCYKKLNLKYAGYYCQQCHFVAHLDCAGKNIFGPSTSDYDQDINFEEREEHDELKHFDHEHKLIISRNEVEVHDHKLCEGCMQSIISAPFYSCDQCNYFLHSTCARLPLKKRHPSHPHPLTLSARGRGNYIDGLTSCGACKRLSHGFAYICHDCNHEDYSLDIRCCLIPKTFKHEGHQHCLNNAMVSVQKCNGCEKSGGYPGLFVCTECNFALGFECATLPLKAKYEHDLHPLSLTYTVENNSGEYYCLICEKERNPKHWFYYCAECNFAAHSQCVVGWFPYIKYGKNFIQYGHQHPFTFVHRTEDSRPCDGCGETFKDGVALNCTQCKIFIHWCFKCVQKFIVKH